jgi:hypothetical protein
VFARGLLGAWGLGTSMYLPIGTTHCLFNKRPEMSTGRAQEFEPIRSGIRSAIDPVFRYMTPRHAMPRHINVSRQAGFSSLAVYRKQYEECGVRYAGTTLKMILVWGLF